MAKKKEPVRVTEHGGEAVPKVPEGEPEKAKKKPLSRAERARRDKLLNDAVNIPKPGSREDFFVVEDVNGNWIEKRPSEMTGAEQRILAPLYYLFLGRRAAKAEEELARVDEGRRAAVKALEETQEGRVQLYLSRFYRAIGCPRLPQLVRTLKDSGVDVSDGTPGPRQYTFTLESGDSWAPSPDALSKALSRWKDGSL